MNNFTVLLVEKPQDPELVERLFERLQTAFKLSAEQARTLANKPAGPILKATTEARAKQVAALYSSLGLEVRIVDLANEAPRSAPVRQVVAARPSVNTNVNIGVNTVKVGDGLMEADAKLPSADTASLSEPGLSGQPNPFIEPQNAAITPRRAVVAAPAEVQASAAPTFTPPSSDDNQSVTIRTTIAAPPDMTPAPSITLRTRPTLDGSSAASALPQAAALLATPSSATSSSRSASPVASASSSTTTARADTDDALPETTMEEALGAKKGRSSLQTRVLLTALLPLIALSAAILIFLSIALPGILRNLTTESAKRLAISVGSSVNLEDLSNLETNLTTLASQPSVGFVSVKSSVVDQFKDKALENRIDLTINQAIQDYMNENPQLTSFVWTDNVAGYELLRRQDTARSEGEMSSIKTASYDKAIAAVKDRPVNSYEIVRTGVNDNDGRRTFVAADPAKADFIVTVAIITNESQRTIRNTLLLASLFSLILVIISAVLAIVTARRIIRPILGLVDAANEISLGKLENPVTVNSNDEIGDLGRALERMRVSLGAALERLRRRRR
ncbi:MAG: HAMP domain-containing protein [Pseudopedobacter sp.]|nr:HAMP domain-containing protein [Deinococcales bacterium]